MSYRLGRAFEYRARNKLRAAGYFVVRAAQSKGLVDLAAFRHGRVLFVQCKRSGMIDREEWNALFDLATEHKAVPVLAEGRGVRWWELKARREPRKRGQRDRFEL